MLGKIGFCDTTFARLDLAKFALDAINDSGETVKVERYTVPGIKDLPVAAKKLFEEHNCDIVMAFGMPGREAIDKQCSHEASLGLIQVQLQCTKHILEVFVHSDEADSKKELLQIAKNRAYKHAANALQLLKGKDALSGLSGKGLRQGLKDEGPVLE